MPVSTAEVRRGALGSTAMRLHELAVAAWLAKWAHVREGYPVPVVFTSPMDAFAHFQNLWRDDNNPFRYLLALKDTDGKPLYQPHPQPVRYPIISVHRRGWTFRPAQNFSLHRWRHGNWPTVSDTGTPINGKPNVGTGLVRPDLGEVTVSRMPLAFNFRFQLDHFCNRPDTQAFFVEQYAQEMWRCGAVPQTWIPVPYPGYGTLLVRLAQDGEIDNVTPEEPEADKNVEFRTSIGISVEGWFQDYDFRVWPALWKIITADVDEVDPTALRSVYTFDGRQNDENPVVDDREGMPPDKTTAEWRQDAQTAVIDVDASAGWRAEA